MNYKKNIFYLVIVLLTACNLPQFPNKNGEKVKLDPNWKEIYPIADSTHLLARDTFCFTDTASLWKKYYLSEQKLPALAKKMAGEINHYKQQPVYWLELIRHGGNKVLFELNGIPLSSSYTSGGIEEVINIFNTSILKSGEQKLKVRVFTQLSEFGDYGPKLNLIIGYSPDIRKRNDRPQYITDVTTLPDSVLTTNYWETEICFNANVPWDYSERIDSAQDLRSIPNINQLILKKYEELRQNLINCDIAGEGMARYSNSLLYNQNRKYLSTQSEILNEKLKGKSSFAPTHPGKKVFPIQNYELAYYKNGKIAVLRNSYDKAAVLRILRSDPKTPEDLEEYYYSYMLFMPKGSNELEIW